MHKVLAVMCRSQNLHRKVGVVLPVTPGQGVETGEPMGLADKQESERRHQL